MAIYKMLGFVTLQLSTITFVTMTPESGGRVQQNIKIGGALCPAAGQNKPTIPKPFSCPESQEPRL